MLANIVYAGTICPSYLLASTTLEKLVDLPIPEKQVERLTRAIGTERVAERDAQTVAYESLRLVGKFETPVGVSPPDLAVVMVDGGRLQVLESEDPLASMASPGPRAEETTPIDVPLDEEEPPAKQRHWREDRIGLLQRLRSETATSDPYPHLPAAFLHAERMRKLVRELTQQAKMMVGVEDASPPEGPWTEVVEKAADYQPPAVCSSRVLATRLTWEDFAPLLAQEAWAWGFQKASRKAFVADGARCNWTLQKRCFAQFVPILDFIHALSYVYAAAMAGHSEAEGWACYRQWIDWVWQGQVEKTIIALSQRQDQLGVPNESDATTSPRRILAKTLTYLQNHQDKMHYDEYRRQGLPITSSHMESTVKLIGRRVKGTEKFWSEEGAEAILQLRADCLSDHQPLDGFWQRRQDGATGLRTHRRAG